MPHNDDDDLYEDEPRRRVSRHDQEEDDYDDERAEYGRVKPHNGVMILVFGIVGLLFCQMFGIVAFVMGRSDLKEIDAGRMDHDGRGLVFAGYVMGIISTIIMVLSFSIVIVASLIG
ncbi:DUF4190 domain-containing protein [Zavarzinella formosa]|uniref:DUF4190 domain-containing protein n=1 Tax=Zavarzinella formosa TaxID=360055 RepID=UPI00030566E0|nr:DUF4190 domain-containing protein [Zavarzinella formosa]